MKGAARGLAPTPETPSNAGLNLRSGKVSPAVLRLTARESPIVDFARSMKPSSKTLRVLYPIKARGSTMRCADLSFIADAPTGWTVQSRGRSQRLAIHTGQIATDPEDDDSAAAQGNRGPNEEGVSQSSRVACRCGRELGHVVCVSDFSSPNSNGITQC